MILKTYKYGITSFLLYSTFLLHYFISFMNFSDFAF